MANIVFNDTLQLLPVSVLTGFLGDGKTTVLKHLMQRPSMSRTFVLINEFGEIGLDHDLITHSSDDVVIEMASGCLCCTIRGDLAKTLRDAPASFAAWSAHGSVKADQIRAELAALGVTVEGHADGSAWRTTT